MGREDIAFYESALVMKAAKALNSEAWDTLSAKRKRMSMERALDVLVALFNDAEVVERLHQIRR
jgi:hypothetical protein